MHITLFDLPPVKEYDLYMSSFGRTNAQQVCERVFPKLSYSLSVDPQLSIHQNLVPGSIMLVLHLLILGALQLLIFGSHQIYMIHLLGRELMRIHFYIPVI